MQKKLLFLIVSLTYILITSTGLFAQEGYFLRITQAADINVVGKEIKVEGTGDWHGCLPLGQVFTTQLTSPYIGGPYPIAPLDGHVGVCKRGTYWYSDKAYNIWKAGGVGMIQINDTRPPLEHLVGKDTVGGTWAISIDDAEEAIFMENDGLQFEFIYKPNTQDVVYWGNLPGQGDFSNGLGEWTYTSNCEAAAWKVSINGFGKGAYGDNSITSPTSCNGAVYFQSDSLDNGGIQGNQANGPCPAHQFTYLTSPRIDLSNLDPDQVISLQFYSASRQFYSKYWVAWSSDDGLSWDSTEINQDLVVNDGHFSRKMRVRLRGLQNTDQVRVRFIYDANYYFWVLDDIKLVKLEDYNIKLPIETNWFAGPVMVQNQKQQKTTNIWMTDVENAGGKKATNVNLTVTVRDTTTKALIYNYSHKLGDIGSGDTIQNIVNQALTFVTPNAQGVYEIEYQVTMDSTDYDLTDNSKKMLWMITDSIWSQEIAYTNAYTVANDRGGHSRLIGNIYKVENASPNLSFDHLSVGYFVNSATLQGKSAEIRVYEFEDLNSDQQINPTEMTGGQYLASSEFSIGQTGENIDTLRLYDLDYKPTKVTMKPGKSYLVAMNFVNDINNEYIFQLVDESYNFSATEYAQYLLDEALYYRPTSLFQSTETLADFNISRGRYSVLGNYMRVWTPDRLALNNNVSLPTTSVKLFPTIAKNFIFLEFDLPIAHDVQVQITDLTGKVVFNTKISKIQNDTYPIRFGTLQNGDYFLQVITNDGKITKPFKIIN